MRSFRSTLSPFHPDFHINHQSSMLFMGSCFAEHMARKMSQLKFKCNTNPYGILYHPLNMANCINMCFSEYNFTEKDLVERDGYWYSLWHHSQINHENPASLIDNLQTKQEALSYNIQNTNVYIFTFGTAYYYKHKYTGVQVGNCHKLPADAFEKKRASSETIAEEYQGVISKILEVNPKAKFLFTVSPVRHIKDGIIENNRSKAILHLAIEKIVQNFEAAVYFPAYEIMMDDLRDYRFYNADLLHPNEVAIDYIWEHFSANLFSGKTSQINTQISTIQNAVAHKAFQPTSEQHQTFVKSTLNKIDSLLKTNPTLDFNEERNKLSSVLI